MTSQIPAATTATRVLVVDDELDIRESLGWRLEADGYDVRLAATGHDAIRLAAEVRPDIVILDLVLPDLGGIDVLRRLRDGGSDAIIMLLSGRSDEVDRIVALASGADDFVLKPCSPREIAARLIPFARRATNATRAAPPDRPSPTGPVLDPGTSSVTIDGTTVSLAREEFIVLSVLAARRGDVVSREQLAEALIEANPTDADESRPPDVAAVVRSLRSRIEPDQGTPRLIKTIRGRGYVLVL